MLLERGDVCGIRQKGIDALQLAIFVGSETIDLNSDMLQYINNKQTKEEYLSFILHKLGQYVVKLPVYFSDALEDGLKEVTQVYLKKSLEYYCTRNGNSLKIDSCAISCIHAVDLEINCVDFLRKNALINGKYAQCLSITSSLDDLRTKVYEHYDVIQNTISKVRINKESVKSNFQKNRLYIQKQTYDYLILTFMHRVADGKYVFALLDSVPEDYLYSRISYVKEGRENYFDSVIMVYTKYDFNFNHISIKSTNIVVDNLDERVSLR